MFPCTTARRALGLAVLALAAAQAPAAAQQLPPARQLVDRYVDAIGARAVQGRFNHRRMVTEMAMPAMGMNMTVEVYQARPNKMFSRTEIPGMGTVTTGYDGTTAWTNNPMQGPRILEGRELAEALRQAQFDNYDFAQVFQQMETVGERTVEGRPCWNVKMSVTEGAMAGMEAHYCFDKETGLASGATLKTSSQMGDVEMDMVISDYQDFDGLKLPARTTVNVMGQTMTSTVKSVSHEPFDESVFAVPAEVRALRPQS